MGRLDRRRLLLALASLPAGLATAAERPCVGWIEELRGPAQWRPSPRAQWTALDERIDRYRPLFSGEEVRCQGKGVLTLALNGTKRTLTAARGVLAIPPPIRASGAAEGSISAYGRRLGAERPADSVLYAPAEGGQVRPETLVIRWNAAPSLGQISLWIKDPNGEELWRAVGVDGTRGELSDGALRQKLRDARPVGLLQLTLRDGNGVTHSRPFSVLPAVEEALLARELAAADGAPGLLRRVERVHAYLRRRLYAEASAEYQEALAGAPESRALLERALDLCRLTGDAAGAEALSRRLAALRSAR